MEARNIQRVFSKEENFKYLLHQNITDAYNNAYNTFVLLPFPAICCETT